MLTSLFYSKNSNLISGTVALLLLAGGTYALIQYGEKNKFYHEERALAEEEAEARQKATNEAHRKRETERLRLEEEHIAKMKAHRAAAIAQKAAEERRIKEEQLRAAKLEAEKIARQAAQELREQQAREQAWSDFIGTKFDTFEIAGTDYNDVTITKVNAIGISFTYEHGARRFKYSELPTNIQKLCLYDEELAKKALIKEQEATLKRVQHEKQLRKQQREQAVAAAAARSSENSPSVVTPRGHIKSRVIASDSNGSTFDTRSRRHIYSYKTLEVKVTVNVPSILYNNGRIVGEVDPGSRTFVTKSGSKGRYSLILKSKSGVTLDREAHNRKTGLGGASGLN